jgi:hypothetical protein
MITRNQKFINLASSCPTHLHVFKDETDLNSDGDQSKSPQTKAFDFSGQIYDKWSENEELKVHRQVPDMSQAEARFMKN